MRWPYFIGYNYDILGTFGQNVLWDSSFKAKAIFVLLCISPICLHAILLGFVKYCFEKRNGKVNWKNVVNFSTLGLLGNFSDSSKILSVTRNIVQNRYNVLDCCICDYGSEQFGYPLRRGPNSGQSHFCGEEKCEFGPLFIAFNLFKNGNELFVDSYNDIYEPSYSSYSISGILYMIYDTDYGDNLPDSSMDRVILSGVFIGISFILDIFWILVLKSEI